MKWTARIGYAARGLVYLLAGLFSLLAGAGGDSVGPKGALSRIMGWPFGETLVYAIAAGLVCFAGWRIIQAIYDPDRFASGPSSLLRRVFVYGGSAAIHLAMAAMAINLALVARATDVPPATQPRIVHDSGGTRIALPGDPDDAVGAA